MDKYYFSKIELFDEKEVTSLGFKHKQDRKRKRKCEKLQKQGILIGRDPSKLLKMAHNYTNPGEESDLKRKWKIASLRAQGVKVKDDVSLLKKSADRQRKLRKKRSEKWQERLAQVEQQKTERQEKRSGNIKARRDRKLQKKLKKAKARGRVFNIDKS